MKSATAKEMEEIKKLAEQKLEPLQSSISKNEYERLLMMCMESIAHDIGLIAAQQNLVQKPS